PARSFRRRCPLEAEHGLAGGRTAGHLHARHGSGGAPGPAGRHRVSALAAGLRGRWGGWLWAASPAGPRIKGRGLIIVLKAGTKRASLRRRAACWMLAALLVGFGIEPVAFAAGYNIYVSNEYGASVTVIDGATEQVIKTIPLNGRPGEVRPRGMAVSPDGRTIYVAQSDFFPILETPDDRIIAIDVLTNEVVAEYWVGTNPERVAISPDGTQIWAANENAALATGYDITTGQMIGEWRVGVEPEGIGVSPDGRWVYATAETSHTVAVIDVENKRVVKFILVGNRPRDLVFHPNGTRAYVTAEIGGTVSVIDVATHTVVDTISLGLDSRPVEIDITPDGKLLFVAGGGTSAVYVIEDRKSTRLNSSHVKI